MPKDRLLVSNVPKELMVEVRGQGFSLLRHYIGRSFLPIVFNVYTDILQKKNLSEKTLNTNELRERIQNQLTSGIQFQRIKPEIIRFEFSPSKEKTVPVVPLVDYTLKRQYILRDSISITPSSITVSGPAAVIDTLRAIYTKPIQFKELAKDVSKSISFIPVEGVSFEENNATLNIEVERVTESKKNIPLVVRHLPAEFEIRLFPPHIELSFDVGLSRYDQIKDSDFVVSVDYRKITNSSALTITVEKHPPFIQNLTYTPERVEFLIEKRSP